MRRIVEALGKDLYDDLLKGLSSSIPEINLAAVIDVNGNLISAEAKRPDGDLDQSDSWLLENGKMTRVVAERNEKDYDVYVKDIFKPLTLPITVAHLSITEFFSRTDCGEFYNVMLAGKKGIILLMNIDKNRFLMIRATTDVKLGLIFLDVKRTIAKLKEIPYRLRVRKEGLEQKLKNLEDEFVASSPPFDAYRGTEQYIFVSYAHDDNLFVYPELRRLNNLGYRIWYDEGIPPTSEWPAEVQNAVENCSLFLVFISANSVESQNVRNEINYSIKKGKPILPIFIEPTELKYGLDLQIGTRQAIMKYACDDAKYFKELLEGLPIIFK